MNIPQNSADWLGLNGQVFAVTGAASGIGAAIAAELIAAGARVALLDRNVQGCEALRDEYAGRAAGLSVHACDISDEQNVQQVAAEVLAAHGQIDGLVNCAGMLRPGSIREVSLEDWERVLRTNLTGYMLCSRAFAEPMLERGRGALVHVASVAAHHPQTYSGAYSAGKAGILLLSRQIAVEYGGFGIRSNAVCPGMIRTALSEPFYQQPGIKEQREAMTASRRIGAPVDIANAVLFLLSERSSYVNGGEVVVDGGMEGMLMDLIPRPGYSELKKA